MNHQLLGRIVELEEGLCIANPEWLTFFKSGTGKIEAVEFEKDERRCRYFVLVRNQEGKTFEFPLSMLKLHAQEEK